MMTYKGYSAKIEYDDDAEIFHGSVLNLIDVITFQGRSVDALKEEFAVSIETYLKMCRDRGEEPEKPFSGKFVVRVEPDLHRAVALSSKRDGKKMNSWIVDVLRQAVSVPASHQAQDHADIGEAPTLLYKKVVSYQAVVSLPNPGSSSQEKIYRSRFASRQNRIVPSLERNEFAPFAER